MSSRMLTVVPRGSTVAEPSGAMTPWLTTSSPPRRMIFWVLIRLLAPSAMLPSDTSAPAAGDSSAAAELSGARMLRAPRTLRAFGLECARSIWARPSRSASAARNSALTSHESRSSAIRSRTRNVQMPSLGLRVPCRSAGWECRRSAVSAAVSMSNSPYTSARMKVLRNSSTRTPILRKQSGRPPVGGVRSTSRAGGRTTRSTRAVMVSSPLPAVVARARHQAPLPAAGGGVVPSTEVVWALARANPSAAPSRDVGEPLAAQQVDHHVAAALAELAVVLRVRGGVVQRPFPRRIPLDAQGGAGTDLRDDGRRQGVGERGGATGVGAGWTPRPVRTLEGLVAQACRAPERWG